jgi:hypothetical protein
MQVDVALDAQLQAMLQAGAKLPTAIRGTVSNNLAYILRLMEYGHSAQLPAGWLRGRQDTLRDLLAGEVRHALTVIPDDVLRAVTAGVSTGTLAIARDVATHTPVDTGRAKGAWVARPPVGSPVQPVIEGDPVLTAAQQQAIKRRRAREA